MTTLFRTTLSPVLVAAVMLAPVHPAFAAARAVEPTTEAAAEANEPATKAAPKGDAANNEAAEGEAAEAAPADGAAAEGAEGEGAEAAEGEAGEAAEGEAAAEQAETTEPAAAEGEAAQGGAGEAAEGEAAAAPEEDNYWADEEDPNGRPPEPRYDGKSYTGKGEMIAGGVLTGVGAITLGTMIAVGNCDPNACEAAKIKTTIIPLAAATGGIGLILLFTGVGHYMRYKKWETWTPSDTKASAMVAPSVTPGGGAGLMAIGRF